MVAYVIFTRENTRDRDQLDLYRQMAPASFEGHEASFRVRQGRCEVREGPKTETVMMLEFPSFEAATAWYESPAYQEASIHRFRGGDYRCIIVEGS